MDFSLLHVIGQIFPVPALILIGGLGVYWSSRLSGAGRQLPLSDQHALDDAFHGMMVVALTLYALMARALTGMGALAALAILGAYVGTRLVRRRGIGRWSILLVSVAWMALSYRMHHTTYYCTRFINNVG